MAKTGAKRATGKKARPVIGKRQTQLLEGAMAGGFAFVIGSVFLISSLQNFFMSTNQFASVIDAVLVDLTNTDRAAYNLGGLKVNPLLTKAAQDKANDMAAHSYFAHTSPTGVDSWYWFKEAGYDFQNAGENLAVDFSDSADVERAWMNSPSHRDNILNGKYTEIGIATAQGYYQGHPTVFVVQEFGSPRVSASPKSAQSSPAFQTVPKNPTEIATAENPSNVLGDTAEAPSQTTPVAVAEVHPKPNTPTHPVAVAQTKEPQPKAADTPAPSPVQPVVEPVRQSNDWQLLATSPSLSLRYAYYLLAILVLIALALDTGLEIRWHHRKRAATAGFMLAAMALLFWYADVAIFTHATVAQAPALTRPL